MQSRPSYVCFSAQDWWYHNRGHSDIQLMRRIAADRRVLFVNSIGLRMPVPGKSSQFLRRIARKARSVARLVRRPLPDVPGFYVMTPIPLPFYGSPRLRKLGALLVRTQVRAVCLALRIRDPIIVVTIPTAWDVVAPMRRRALLFNRSDLHSAYPQANGDRIRDLERDLLAGSDRVVYVSRALKDSDSAIVRDRGHFLDHGVDLELFRRTDALPSDLAAIPAPRIGFFGGLDDYVVDFDLLERVANEFSGVAIVLIGDATTSMRRFERYPNVHWLGPRPYEQIPRYGSGFDVALMPWLENEWIEHANPIKLKEYLALGLPIVSTSFPEVRHYANRVVVANSHDEFVAAIRRALDGDTPSDPDARRASVMHASWHGRARELMDLAEGRS
jgi:glycosyltransferase involved in cell wall biosynthesis